MKKQLIRWIATWLPGRKIRCGTSIGIFLAVAGNTFGFHVARALDSFEENMTGWHASGGQITQSSEHWKLGAHSLRWDFVPRSVLSRDFDQAQKNAMKNGGVKFWIYCERPVKGTLQFQAGSRSFPFYLGFTGWRAAWVSFREDARDMFPPFNGLQIKAPDTSGTVFIDAVEFGPIPWNRQGDAQAPYVNAKRGGGKEWGAIQEYASVQQPVPTEKITPENRKAFDIIRQRYDNWIAGGLDDCRTPVQTRLKSIGEYIKTGNALFDKLGLQRHGGIVSGPGHFNMIDTHTPYLCPDLFEKIALPLALDARLNNNRQARQRFLDLIDYAHDQGWAAGSLMGSGYFFDLLHISGYVNALYIMQDFLRQEGRLQRELDTLRYRLSMGEIYQVPVHPGGNADDLRTLFLYRLLYVLMLDDSPEKMRDMKCLVRWADAGLAVAPAYADTIKPDGTVFHHQTAYASAYGNEALLMSSLIYWLLRDTPFRLSLQTGENIKKALLTLRYMGGQYDLPMGVSGRFPFSGTAPMVTVAPAFAYMADSLNDAELGGAFARLWNPDLPWIQKTFQKCSAGIFWSDSPGSLPWLLDVRTRYRPETAPSGHRSYPFAAMDFHRRQQWAASVRGWSRYVWNYENGPQQNLYGRYSSYGTLQIFSRDNPVTGNACGWSEDGWDWLRPPGATIIRVPLEDLRNSKVPMRQYTQETFVGGLTLENTDGLWAMRFTDPCYDKSFRFCKSVFFVDSTIVCLGSGISNRDSAHPTETILFQTSFSALPSSVSVESQQSNLLIDPLGNGYFVPGSQSVKKRIGLQESMRQNGKQKTSGNFAAAWLNHGLAPDNQGYTYAIRPDTTVPALQAFAAAPDFQVIRRDNIAHIVNFPDRGLMGYVLFQPIRDLPDEALAGADTPCLVMTRRNQNARRLTVAAADPNLRLKTTLPRYSPDIMWSPGPEHSLHLYLNGNWKLISSPDWVAMRDNHTVEIKCRDGATTEFIIEKK